MTGSLPFEDFVRLIDGLPGLDRLTLQGLGEPLLHPRLVDMVEYASARGVRVGFNSNATLFTEMICERLIRAGLGWLHISVDASTAATYEHIRDGANFEKMCRNVRRLVDAKRRLGTDDLRGQSFHVHVPAGAIPKDGPSAGITMTTALASLLTERPVKHTVGMTGEVTLQGRVLPIGGLKQKVLAAHAAGLTDVIIPERNRADLEDVPADVREAVRFHPVMTLGEVLELALEPKPKLQAVG